MPSEPPPPDVINILYTAELCAHTNKGQKGVAKMPYKKIDDMPLMLGTEDLRVLFGRDDQKRGKRQTYELVHSEGFPSMRLGAHILVPKWKLIEWIDEQASQQIL